MDAYLKEQEDRQARESARYEAMRDKAEERHNYLVQHNQEMLDKALQQQIEYANRHEELRKQAEERRKRLAAFRSTMKDMTPEERWAYLDEHREELFGPEQKSQEPEASQAYPAPPPPPPLPPVRNPYMPEGAVPGPYGVQ